MSTRFARMLSTRAATLLTIATLASAARAQLVWHQLPSNQHWYAKVEQYLTWTAAEALAVNWGGHLLTVRSAYENTWVVATFGDFDYWIGLTDSASEGIFVWSSGEPVAFTNWEQGQPSAASAGHDYGRLHQFTNGSWVDDIDISWGQGLFAIIEIASDDCDSNGVPDVFEIAVQPSLDLNQNNQLDVCETLTYCTAKVNSLGCTPSIAWTGTPSLAGPNDDFHITASNVLNNKNGLLFWGPQDFGAPFQGGTLCVKPPIVRTNVQTSGGNPPPSDCSGAYNFHLSQAYMSASLFQAGTTIYAQYWSRDPGFNPPNNVGLTDALRVVVCP